MTSSQPASPLLGMKFEVPPRPPGRVARGRLAERLAQGARGPLTLLSAPPGFGKTTLLVEWLTGPARPEGKVAWLSLDGADDQASAFWTYLVTALCNVSSRIEETGALAILDAPQPPPIETLLTLVLNAVGAEADELTLVLDDYHLIESEAVHRGMAFLVDHLPPRLHVVIASRADPALPLPRLRARGQLTEIRAGDLRFTTDEAAEFLNGSMQLGLADDDIARLGTRTEGWAGALQLAALSLQGREERAAFIDAFAGDDRFVVDYLVEEVLDRQPPAVRSFLVRTSILDRLSAPLCDAVTGNSDGREMLEILERTNLFIAPLDARRGWFRYHQLFADMLRIHLSYEYADELPELHRRASAWFAAAGEPDRAITHAMAAGDYQQAAGLIELEAAGLMKHHHPDRIVQWLNPVPHAVIERMPMLSTFYGHALQGMGDMEGSARWLSTAEAFMRERPQDAVVFDHESFAMFPAMLAVGQGYLSMTVRDAEATVRHGNTALANLPEHEYHWRATGQALLGLAHWVRGELEPAQELHALAVGSFERTGDSGLMITSSYHDADLLKARGRLNAAERRLESGLRFVAARERTVRGAANLYLGLSDVRCERNDLEGAAEAIERAVDIGVYPPRTPFRLLLTQARLAQSQGDFEEAVQLLDEAERLWVRGAVPEMRTVAAWRARLWARMGRFEEAFAWVRSQGLSADDDLDYAREYGHITLARLLLTRDGEGDLAAVTGLLERLLEAARAGKRDGTAIEIAMLLAEARAAEGDEPGAVETLAPALRAAEPEGYRRLFLDEGPGLSPLLRAAAQRGISPGYCRLLLEAAADVPRPAPPAVAIPEALSEREAEVLRLLGTVLSGPEIANELVITLHTLRSHTKNIYGKLGVNSRREAVSRATELGLL